MRPLNLVVVFIYDNVSKTVIPPGHLHAQYAMYTEKKKKEENKCVFKLTLYVG